MKVRVINAEQGKSEVINVEAGETWGDLRTKSESLFSGDVKGVIRETRQSLEHDDAQLPTEALSDNAGYDYTVFLVVKKSKAGDMYEDMSFSELRQLCSERDGIIGNRGNYGRSEERRVGKE